MLALTYASSPLAILVVDDEPTLREIVGEMLGGDGHVVGLAGNGAEALRELRRKKWDLVLTDRAMPGIGGAELAMTIKFLYPLLPVVMMTGDLPPGGCPGVDVVVRKPFSRATLAQAISDALALRAPAAAPLPPVAA